MNENINNMIYLIRDKFVMLDSDLAKLYQVQTKRINEIVKRNKNKFLEIHSFILNNDEFLNLRSQSATSSLNTYGGKRYNSRVFTIEGITILNNILKKENKEIIFKKISDSFDLKLNENNKLMPINNGKIENLIYEIRGKQVMFDYDLTRLYQCKNGTKEINQAVKNNPEKFPERFSFKLNNNENNIFLVKNFDQKIEYRGGKYKNPRVFTEQGVAMLATILKSEVATKISIAIMDAFVLMRKYISNDLLEQKYINELVFKHENEINNLKNTFNNFKSSTNEIFFDGQIYDAYSKLVDIMKEAQNDLIIIDNYADKNVLDMIRNIKVKTLLIVKTKSLLKELDVNKYNEQYHNLEIIYDDSFHDRYIIIDKMLIYHCGTSLNYAGSKTFSLNKINDKNIISTLLNDLDKHILKN